MAMIHYKLPYDTEVDAELHEWLNGLPKSYKAEAVRHALRYYLNVLKKGEVFKLDLPAGVPVQTNVETVTILEKPVDKVEEVIETPRRFNKIDPNALKRSKRDET